jgi:hypothetical protein
LSAMAILRQQYLEPHVRTLTTLTIAQVGVHASRYVRVVSWPLFCPSKALGHKDYPLEASLVPWGDIPL